MAKGMGKHAYHKKDMRQLNRTALMICGVLGVVILIIIVISVLS